MLYRHLWKRALLPVSEQSSRLRSLPCRCLSSNDGIERATQQALQLLQHKHLTSSQIDEAHNVLETFNLLKAKTPESIKASFRLLALLGREGHPGDHFNALLHRWRSAKFFGQKVPNPRQIMQSLRAFKHDARSLSIVASVQAWMAPKEMKHVSLEIYMERIEARGLKPELYMFHQLLRAWVISGHDDTGECLMGLLMRIEKMGYEHTATEYAFLLRYWTGRYFQNDVEVILQKMEMSTIPLNVECFAQAILMQSEYCQPWKAEYLLRDMMEQYPKCLWKITWCVVRLIKSYTRSLEIDTKHMREATESVELLSDDVLEMCKGDHGLEGMCPKAYELFEKIKRPSIAEYCGLIRAYGRDDKAKDAMHVLQKRMPSRPLVAYHSALQACLHFSKPSTANQARKLWRQLQQEGLEPGQDQYVLYLEVLSKWKGQNVYTEKILNEMEEKGLSLTDECYHYAIQACVMSRDWKRCRALLIRMSEAGIYPTVDTYSDYILPFCDPRRGEEVVAKMRGNIVNCDTYHSVMVKWMRTPSKVSQDKVFALYEAMLQRGVKPDNETYSILISYFVKRDFLRTEKLLNDLEDNDDIDSDYSHYNPLMEAHLRNKRPRRAAEILLRRAHAYLRQQNHEDIMPLPDNIHDVIGALVEQDDLPAASWLLGTLHYMPLTLFSDTYDMMIDAWSISLSKDKESRIGRIKALLKDVEERKVDPKKKPKKMKPDDIFAEALSEMDIEGELDINDMM